MEHEHNGSASFNGFDSALTTNGKVLASNQSFSVSAWVKLRTLDMPQTVVAQEANYTTALALRYSPTTRRWSFRVQSADVEQPFRNLTATRDATLEWTHLTATYNQDTSVARLYVNGAEVGVMRDAYVFSANGKLTIGRGRSAGQPGEWFNGLISDVRVHQRTLSANDALLTYQQPNFAPFPNTGVLTGPDYKTELERSVLSAPNVRTMLVALGSTEILRGVPADQVRATLTDLINSRTGLKKQQRHDGSALHVVMTTVPPLGLEVDDPREVQRRQLNADILVNYRNYDADHVVDFDAAVRDGGDVGKVAPQYLTGGVANDAYHGRLAEYLAEAVNDFPPRAEL